MAKKKTTKVTGAQITEMIIASPENGSMFIDPQTHKPIPYGGKKVPSCGFWQRRIADGSVVTLKKIKE